MVKRIVVAGSRYYDNYEQAKEYVDFCLQNIVRKYSVVFISGGCKGADLLGEKYANEHGFPIERYIAEWNKYGKSAGPLRNKKMAEAADYIICFWDGKSRGTKSMIEYAKNMEKPIKIKWIE